MNNKRLNKYSLIIFFVMIITIVMTAILINPKKEKVALDATLPNATPTDYIIFEGVGNYAFATAGNNNAYRGTSVNSGDYSWIQSFPESDKVSYDWETVKNKILTETGLTEITNMSGSYLNIDGEVQKALLSAVISKSNGSGYKGRVLLLKPDGSYNILNFNTNYWMTVEDITSLLVDSQKGWYYISYLDASAIPQSGWTIAAVYENPSIEKNYIKMLNVNKTIQNGGQISVMFESKFKLQKNFQLMGVVMLAGSNGFQVLDTSSSQSSLDRAFAILDDNTEFQLYDRGDGHFKGRSNIDFANDIYGAQRSHNIPGGELDIFDERLDSSYFGGKNIVGYRFIKDGRDLVNISSLGLSQSIVDSNLSVTTKITADSKFKENSNISIKSTIKNNLENGYCYSAYNNVITNTVDNSLSNVTNIKAYLNGTTALTASYDSTTRKIIIEEIEELTCTDEIVLTFDATVNSNIENSIKNNKYNLTSVINNNYSLIHLSNLTGEELTKYESLKANEEATDTVTSPRNYKVTINHYKSGTTTKLADSTTINLYEGESYTSSAISSLLTNYNVTTPANATGTVSGNVTVNYYYTLKQATITIKYLEEGTNKVLATTETKTLNYTDTYSYTAKDIANYKFSGESNTVSGTVNGNKEIIFYYTRKQATLTVHHYIEGTTTKLAESEISTVYWGETYTTNKSSNISSNYEYSKVQGTTSGTVAGNITVIYYYKLKTATITVHHYIENTTTKLAEDVITTQNYTTTYTTSKATVNSNYELVSTPTNATGTVSGNVTVTYYYKLKTATITVHHYIENTTTKLAEDVITTQNYTTTYKTSPATVNNNYELVATPTNASGTVSGNVTVTYYYKLKTATITVHHYIENTTTKLAEDVITTQKYTTAYNTTPATVDSNYELVATPTNSTGIVSGNVTVIYYYKLKVGTITVHHYIENTTTKLAEDVITNQNYTTTYKTSPATVNKNYELVATPTNASGTVSGNITVTYYYRLKKATLTVNHYIEGTNDKLSKTITETMYWGDIYTTSPATDISVNYKLVSTPSNASGTIAGDVTVNYYYTLKEAKLTIHYYIEGTTTKVSNSIVKGVNWGENYTTSPATDVSINYELVSTPSNATGIIAGDTEVIYYYKLKTATITIHHYIEGTTTELASTTIKNVHWGDSYTTSPATVDSNYELVKTPTNASGTVSGNITVTYYYKLKIATITVHHYIDGTTTKLANDQVSTEYFGNTYTTDIHKDIPNNYELKRKTDNYTGTVNSKTIEVIYYYQKKDSSLETTITKTGPEEVTKKDEIVEYTITYKATTKDYIGNGTITIVDTLPYHIDLEQSNLDNGTYNKETNTITWTIPWNDIDSYNGKGETTIIKTISLVYTDLLPTDRIMINSVKGSITLDNNSREIENQTSTNIKIPGKITIHYYVKGTQIELLPSEEQTNLIGEQITTTAPEQEGYIIHKPETEVYTFTEEPQEVIYEYEKKKVRVTTLVQGNGGKITGDEEFNYGDDSTKDKIVITPDPGYILDEVFINGIKIELSEDEKEKLILHNLTNVKQDMIITVTFIKNSGVNAETGAFANFVYILIGSLMPITIYLKVKKNKLIKIT